MRSQLLTPPKAPGKPRLRVEHVEHAQHALDGRRFAAQLHADGVLTLWSQLPPEEQRELIVKARREWRRTPWNPLEAKYAAARRNASLVLRQDIGGREYRIYFASTSDEICGVEIDMDTADVFASPHSRLRDLYEAIVIVRDAELRAAG